MRLLLAAAFVVAFLVSGVLFYHKKLLPSLLVSVACGIIFFFGYSAYPVLWMGAALILLVVLVLASLEDMKDRTISIYHLCGVLAVVLLLKYLDWSFGWLDWRDTVVAFFCGSAALGIPFLITRGKSLGAGDVVLFMLLSLLLEPIGVFIVLAAAGLISMGGYFIQIRKNPENKRIAFVPSISLAFFIYLTVRLYILQWFS